MAFRRSLVVCLIALFLLMYSPAPATAGDNLSVERAEMKAVLNVVSKDLEKNFYDPHMKGLDWPALKEQTKQKIDSAHSVAEMMRAIFVMVEKLGDSHTRFLPPSRNVRYLFGFDAKPIGDEIRVYEVKKKGAAEAAGIKVGDRILTVNGFKADRSIYDLMMWDFKVIRNAPVIELKLQTDDETPRTVRLEGKKKEEKVILDFTGGDGGDDILKLIRELDERVAWHYQSFKDGIGYAEVRDFGYREEDFFNSLIEKSGAKRAVILDLRNDLGGAEDTLKAFAGNFESEQVVMANIKGRKSDKEMLIKPQRPHYDMPMFILVDSETGSAAEMFAKHFQLRKKAVVIGDRSSGRVTRSMFFQEEIGAGRIIPFVVQIGTERVIFPDGTELEKNGVTPDVPCNPTGREMREEKDVCLWKAVGIARAQLGLPADPDLKEGSKSQVDY